MKTMIRKLCPSLAITAAVLMAPPLLAQESPDATSTESSATATAPLTVEKHCAQILESAEQLWSNTDGVSEYRQAHARQLQDD